MEPELNQAPLPPRWQITSLCAAGSPHMCNKCCVAAPKFFTEIRTVFVGDFFVVISRDPSSEEDYNEFAKGINACDVEGAIEDTLK